MSDSHTPCPSQPRPVYTIWAGSLQLPVTAAEAWPHIIDYPSWQYYSIVQSISGTAGEIGEVVLLKKDELGPDYDAYYARTIDIQAGARIVWKTFRTEDEPRVYFGIVDFSVHDHGGGSVFEYRLAYENWCAAETDGELEEIRRHKLVNVEKLLSLVLPKLQRRVEALCRTRGQ